MLELRHHMMPILLAAVAICATITLERMEAQPTDTIPAVAVWVDETVARPAMIGPNREVVLFEGWASSESVVIRNNLFVGATGSMAFWAESSKQKK